MIRRKEQMTTTDRPNLRGGDGVIRAYNLLEPQELCGKANLCAIMTVEPGCSIGEHPHGPDAELYYMLEGTLEAWDDGKKPSSTLATPCSPPRAKPTPCATYPISRPRCWPSSSPDA